MNFDFALLLVLGVLITGLIWGVDAWVFAPRRRQAILEGAGGGGGEAAEPKAPPAPKEPLLVEYARSFFPVLLIVLLLRSFLVEPFRIPSGSMIPTLLVGDFILVNKFAYGIRLPVLNTKVIPIGEPHRGDVVVFRYPENPSLDYIKRIVGLPGDTIAYYDKTVYVNGKPVPQQVAGGYGKGPGHDMYSLRLEKLGKVEHPILLNTAAPNINMSPVTVPKGMYFAMGDNRDNSRDSRSWGFVPEENLVGEAFLIWMNWDSEDGGGITWSRIGHVIR